MTVEELVGRLQAARQAGTGWLARCPAHDDRFASLSIDKGVGGRVLLNCFAGCTAEAIVRAVGLTLAALMPERQARAARRIVATYRYEDEECRHLYDVVRYVPKDFRQRAADGAWRTKGIRRVLYHLPKLVGHETVFVVEGERDADALAGLGQPATCNPGGAGKWRDDYTHQLVAAGVRRLCVVPDNDEPGRAHAFAVAGSGTAAGLEVRVLELPDLSPKGDVSDWLAAGGTKDALLDLARACPVWTPARGDAPDSTASGLPFLTMSELAALVAAAGPRRYLLRGIWPAGDYGVHAAEMKAQKTWNTTDLAVSVASGTPWLGAVPVDAPGPVVMFVGEGGLPNIWRRLRAIAEARGVTPDALPITVCPRAPHLSNTRHMADVAAQMARQRPVLVTLDPLYLSARGASGSDLYAMGAMLENIQHICQEHGAALFVVTHFNRKPGDGALRITGAGPAEWGRVLIAATVRSRHTDPTTQETTVLSELQIVGGEVSDQVLRVLRRIRADDPDRLDSPLHVSTTVISGEATTTSDRPADDPMSPAAQKLMASLDALGGTGTAAQMVDHVAKTHGHGLKRETVSRTLNDLKRRGLLSVTPAEGAPGRFLAQQWTLLNRPCDPRDVTRDGHRVSGPCDPRDPPYRDHEVTSHGLGHSKSGSLTCHTVDDEELAV